MVERVVFGEVKFVVVGDGEMDVIVVATMKLEGDVFAHLAGDGREHAKEYLFKGLVSVATMGEKKGEEALPENESVDVERIIALRKAATERVREMLV